MREWQECVISMEDKAKQAKFEFLDSRRQYLQDEGDAVTKYRLTLQQASEEYTDASQRVLLHTPQLQSQQPQQAPPVIQQPQVQQQPQLQQQQQQVPPGNPQQQFVLSQDIGASLIQILDKITDKSQSSTVPKILTRPAQIDKLTVVMAKKEGAVIKWLSNFHSHLTSMGVSDNQKMHCLMSETYVEKDVWGSIFLSLEDQIYNYNILVDALDNKYPDRRSNDKFLNIFLSVKQEEPSVSSYFLVKVRAWNDVPNEGRYDQSTLFLSSFRTGLYKRLREYLNEEEVLAQLKRKEFDLTRVMRLLEYKENTWKRNNDQYFIDFNLTNKSTRKIQAIQANAAIQAAVAAYAQTQQVQQYQHIAPPTNPNIGAVAGNQQQNCNFWGTSQGCRRGVNCPFTHQGPPSAADQAFANGSTTQGNATNNKPNKGARVNQNVMQPNVICAKCEGKPNINMHFWIDCKDTTCTVCADQGHTKHRCPKTLCTRVGCGVRGHSAFACGVEALK
jgi:hypothetical protein